MTSETKSRMLVWALVPSVAICAAVLVLMVGLRNTPYDTQDSQGRPMGFNDQLSLEHYGIAARNFTIGRLLDRDYVYEWALIGMHLVGVVLLLSRRTLKSQGTFWFFALQPLLFLPAFLGVFQLPGILGAVLRGTVDREWIIDIPFAWCTAQPVWVATSILVAFLVRPAVVRLPVLRLDFLELRTRSESMKAG